MASGAEYRQYAVDYVALVERASDPDEKARPVSMAQAFFNLAIKTERSDLPLGKGLAALDYLARNEVGCLVSAS